MNLANISQVVDVAAKRAEYFDSFKATRERYWHVLR